MVEPTETETRESLDELAEAIESILAEAEEDPEILRQAPYTTPVRRLDEARRAASRSCASRATESRPPGRVGRARRVGPQLGLVPSEIRYSPSKATPLSPD